MTSIDPEILMSRLCQADAASADWESFEAIARTQPAIWRALAEAQREQAKLQSALAGALAAADAFELPMSHAGHGAAGPANDPAPLPSIPAMLRFWTGWAVAAVLGLAWLAPWSVFAPARPTMTQPVAPSFQLTSLTPKEALEAYLERGRETGLVVGEVPTKVLLDARPDPSGHGYELLYLRQVLERISVPDLYQLNGEDERGQPTLARFDRALDRPM